MFWINHSESGESRFISVYYFSVFKTLLGISSVLNFSPCRTFRYYQFQKPKLIAINNASSQINIYCPGILFISTQFKWSRDDYDLQLDLLLDLTSLSEHFWWIRHLYLESNRSIELGEERKEERFYSNIIIDKLGKEVKCVECSNWIVMPRLVVARVSRWKSKQKCIIGNPHYGLDLQSSDRQHSLNTNSGEATE